MTDGSRLTLCNARVTTRAPNGEIRRRILETTEALAAVLREEFALALSDGDLHELLKVSRPEHPLNGAQGRMGNHTGQ